MKIHKMLLWDAGQVIIAIQDNMLDAASDLRKGGYKKQANIIYKAACEIGDEFNKMKTGHTFDLRGTKNEEYEESF